MGKELEEDGYPGMASAVRPSALGGAAAYEGESAVRAVTRVVDLLKRTTEPPENYVLDAAHHGMAVNHEGTTMCAAGTVNG